MVLSVVRKCGLTEGFHFEVSPSTVLNSCARGFYGRPLHFEYDGDFKRFQQCPSQPPQLLVSPNTFNSLGNTYSAREQFSNDYYPLGHTYASGNTEPYSNDFYKLGQTYSPRERSPSEYAAGPTLTEGYQSSMKDEMGARGRANNSGYADLQQSGQDMQPFVLGVPREHWPINAGHVGGASKIFAGPFSQPACRQTAPATPSSSEGYCGACNGPNA